MRILPAAAGTGLRFRLDDAVEFPAHADFVVDTSRATVLGSGTHRVSTVEHVLSALIGLGITNATIAVDGPEIPALDGSARPFVEAVDAAGIERQSAARPVFTVSEPQIFRDGDKLLAVLPAPAWRVRMNVEFAAPVGAQSLTYDVEPETYRSGIAPNRTFCFQYEIDALLAQGLALGGSLDNAVVFADDGPLTPLRCPDEPVRHKMLDLLGDFALLGAYPQCEVLAFKTGHTLHHRAVRALLEREPQRVEIVR